MAKRLDILVLGRSSKRLDVLAEMLGGGSGLSVTRLVLTEGARSPLAGLAASPDVLVIDLGGGDGTPLQTVFEGVAPAARPPMIVIGPEGDAALMRRAMQAGARDFHTDSVSDEEFLASVRRVGVEAQLSRRQTNGNLTVVINGKGGSGGSFVTSSLGTVPLVSKVHGGSTAAVLDFDFQFGDLPVYFDLPSDDGLLQALARIGDLDAVGLEGLMRTHSSGTRILAGRRSELDGVVERSAGSVSALLGLLSRMNDQVIVDLPRHIDEAVVATLEQADTVLVVTQQTVPHVRDTRFLIGLLRDVGLADETIRIVVNRADRKAQVRMEDLRDVFEDFHVHTIPNDYKRVSESVDNGVPLLTQAPKSPVARAVLQLGEAIWPAPEPTGPEPERGGLFGRATRKRKRNR